MSQSKKQLKFSGLDGELWPRKAAVQTSARDMTNREMFERLDADLFLANQLFRQGLSAGVLDGVTVSAQRRERIRREILAHELEAKTVIDPPRGSAPETLAQAFERLYREPLID